MRSSKPTTDRPAVGYGSIRADELLPLREVGRRLGWGNKGIAQAQRDGLRAISYGKFKYVRGEDVLRFFEALAQRQANGQGGAE